MPTNSLKVIALLMANIAFFNPIKQILENIHFPERLDTHPWVNFRFVQESIAETPELAQKSPGYQLINAVSKQFLKMVPNTPPRQGKRLDTRWGKFGILAAQYFAPFRFGNPYPTSLQDAWGGIDTAILLFVFGKPADFLSANEVTLYKLVGDEAGIAARSTISDWHINGCQQLADLILSYEQRLESSLPEAAGLSAHPSNQESVSPDKLGKNHQPRKSPHGKGLVHWVARFVLLLLAVMLIVSAGKVWRAYQLVQELRSEVSQLTGFISSSPDIEEIKQAGPILDKFRQDIGLLNKEYSAPLRVMGLLLGWLPGYGKDLAASAELLEITDKTAASAQRAYQTTYPLLKEFQTGQLTASDLTKSLLKGQAQYLRAQEELSQAEAIRSGLEVSGLSSRTQRIVQDVDRVMRLLDDGLSIALTIPKILGASTDGPKTYMLLVQNEDELRPTGGFIGVVGSFVLRNGLPMGITFKDSYAFDDWTKPYPEAPRQLEEYMNIPALVLRDANWYTNFPTAVSWIEFLYAYTDNHSVDGVIAIDQQSLVYLLEAIGPVIVKGALEPITSTNIIEFMRDSKAPPATEKEPEKWGLQHRKDFIAPLADSILAKLLSGEGIVWEKVARSMIRALDEHHVLLQFDDPLISRLISKYEWDGELKPGQGDFLMAVDSNIGINKANVHVETKLTYAVDLTDLQNPVGNLVIFHTNRASSAATCSKYGSGEQKTSLYYAMDRCYWNYLRIYVPKGSRLAQATPHFIPAAGTLFGKNVPARVDVLDMEYEEIGNAAGFGTLLGVPGGETLSTSFKFLLPGSVITTESKQKSYTLKIQKQPGTRSPAVTIRIHLPSNARVDSIPAGSTVDGSDILIETNLLTKVNITVLFSIP